MKKHYLHLSVSRCDKCQGPVVTGSLGARENEISREIEKQRIGAVCLACGYRQGAGDGTFVRHFPPVDWPLAEPSRGPSAATGLAEAKVI